MITIHINNSVFKDLKNFDISNIIPTGKSFENKDIKIFIEKNTILPNDCSGLFAKIPITYIEFEKGIDTSNVTNMEQMFYACETLKEIKGLEYLDTSNVTHMGGMFLGCKKLQHLNLSNFNTTKVKNMYSMFAVCTNLEELDLSSFNTTNVENMYSMFSSCTNLKRLNISSFDTKNVKNMGGMFAYTNFDNDISNWDISNVKDVDEMFEECNILEEHKPKAMQKSIEREI